MKETQIQGAILDYLASIGLPAIRLNNGGVYDPMRKVFRTPGKGYTPGLPDIMVLREVPNFTPCFIEVKSEVGVLSEDQKDFSLISASLGYPYIVVRSVADVQHYLRHGTKIEGRAHKALVQLRFAHLARAAKKRCKR